MKPLVCTQHWLNAAALRATVSVFCIASQAITRLLSLVFFPHLLPFCSCDLLVTCFLRGSRQHFSVQNCLWWRLCRVIVAFLALLSSWKSRRSSWKRKCRSFRNISCPSRREHGERLQGRVTLSRYTRINKDGWVSWMQVGAIFWAAKCTIFHQGQRWLWPFAVSTAWLPLFTAVHVSVHEVGVRPTR